MRSLNTITRSFVAALLLANSLHAQSVCLPAPRLMTTMPMGGQAGTSFDVTITGQHVENVEELVFSHKGITAVPKLDASKRPIANQYVVTIAKDCPTGIHEARIMTRLGLSSSRAFNVSQQKEVTRTQMNTSLESAMPLQINSICNAAMSTQAIDYYTFQGMEGQRIIVDCAARGIDSKLRPVVIVADEKGADLKVERRGGIVDFTVPQTGQYVVKLHDLTYAGGPYHFYRLSLRELKPGAPVVRMPTTLNVNACSWPPIGLPNTPAASEQEPNNKHEHAQKITLPVDIAGSFFPAADVDTYEFIAKKGEKWWVEVGSERMGRPTDPAVVVQLVGLDGKLQDVAELNDIPTPVKVSSNGYSYDGPPYNAGSTDVMGSFTAPQDGTYRLQIRDLFGGTRSDPQNIYRLIVRKQQPDFALAAWALHMTLRNGDRNALSKPITLRGGTTMALEVVRIALDGFDDEIELVMQGLPEGVSATAVNIRPGQTRGYLLITAEDDAPRTWCNARIIGRSKINGQIVTRNCPLASMVWPVANAWSEIPHPRLLADVPISVNGTELAPLTIAAKDSKKVWEGKVGDKLDIPLVHTKRMEFSGDIINLKNWNSGLAGIAPFDATISKPGSNAVIDLSKAKPGEYVVAFYGSAVAKYRYNVEAVKTAEAILLAAKQEAKTSAEKAKALAESVTIVPPDQKQAAQQAADEAIAKQKTAEAAVKAAEMRLKSATAAAQPKDIVDIVVAKPIKIRVSAK